VREGRGGNINDWGGKVAVLVTWGVVLGFDKVLAALGQKRVARTKKSYICFILGCGLLLYIH
jgi:hypothetical protein